jgi:hypothetical protein
LNKLHLDLLIFTEFDSKHKTAREQLKQFARCSISEQIEPVEPVAQFVQYYS